MHHNPKGVSERYEQNYVFFVGGNFSQWARIGFNAKIDHNAFGYHPAQPEEYFSTAEKWMMMSKAAMFYDNDVLNQMRSIDNPKTLKTLGRTVKNFDMDHWSHLARDVVFIGNYHKAAQNEEYKKELIATGDRILVEGAHYDPVWGVKLAWDDPLIDDPVNWRGTNWLGQTLMAVREAIQDPTFKIDEYTIEWSSDPTKYGRFILRNFG